MPGWIPHVYCSLKCGPFEPCPNFHCSRTTVHAQKNRALEAAANEFKDPGDEPLFTIAVTQSFIHQMVVGLFCICNSSYRGIMSFLKSIFDYPVALGSVSTFLMLLPTRLLP